MKVVYLLNSLGISGGPVVLYNFAENLVKRGYEVYFVTPDTYLKWDIGTKEKILNREKRRNNKQVLFDYVKTTLKSFGLKKIKDKLTSSDFWFQNIFLPKYVKEMVNNFNKYVTRCDILICTHWTTAFPGYFLSEKCKKIFYHMQHYEEVFSPQSELKRKYTRITYFLPFNLISNSSWLKNIIKKICDRDSYLLCPGIDINMFAPYEDINTKYIKKNKFKISSFVDATREFKGSSDLFQVMKILNEKLDEEKIFFNVFGFGLPSFFKSIKNIEFKGIVPYYKLPQFYSESDLFIWSSWYESFPLPPIESMACGTAVVTTKFGTEDYAIDNFNSYVVLPRNPLKLAEKIMFALENIDKTKEMVMNALNTVKKFSWERQTDKLERYLQEAPAPTISSRLQWLVENLIKGENIEEIDKMIG